MKKEPQIRIRVGVPTFFKGKALPEAAQEETQDNEGKESRRADPLHLFDMNPDNLHDLFKEYDEAMEQTEPPENGPRLRMVRPGGAHERKVCP